MTLDPRASREALAQYQAWNEAEFSERVRNAGKKPHVEKWQEYVALHALARRIKAQLSPLGQIMSNQEWNNYYEQMQLFELRRRSHG